MTMYPTDTHWAAGCSSRHRAIGRRSGLTVLEFVGCLIAIVGGAWLGALYLGVDVRHLAHSALAEADLLESVPPQWRPPGAEEQITREQLVATLREELGVLRGEIAGLHTSKDQATRPASSESQTSPPAVHRPVGSPTAKDNTLAYWTRISDIALGEAALQRDAESAFDQGREAKVFAIKARVSRFAARAVDAVPTAEVDDSVVQFGRQLSAWYERGSDLYDKAVEIWETPAGSPGRAQRNEAWKRAEQHHRNEARLLNDRGAAVRLTVSRHFGQEFPAFAQSAERNDLSTAGGQESEGR